jgi:D-psicose/D-tagatose/L-ribulose 3-epimerase
LFLKKKLFQNINKGVKNMKFGIYYAYWEHEWGGNFVPYIEKTKKLGFDVLEVACGAFHLENDDYFKELKNVADANGMLLSGGYGPRPEHNLASPDSSVVENALKFYSDIFRKMEIAGIDRIGGALYSYWPVDFKGGFDKAADTERSIKNMRRLADIAADHGITLCMESLNRFEGYMINEAYEDVDYVKAVDKPNVKSMLDTFHMNIEEVEDIPTVLRRAGDWVKHVHVGEANRMLPGQGHLDWAEIGRALRDIGYDAKVVMEPFLLTGGEVGPAIKVWRDLSANADGEKMDELMTEAVSFLRANLNG